MPHRFGGRWTNEKLERVRKYLLEYTKIFEGNERARYFTTIYVDAFAGTGSRIASKSSRTQDPMLEFEDDSDREEFLKGSARIALEIEPPFKKYLFVERSAKRAKELEQLKADYPDKASSIEIKPGDANTLLKTWCKNFDRVKNRAVVFLDPYGMQVDWDLLVAIANTQAIDLWVLFPLGAAVSRLLTRREQPPDEWAKALTRTFGTEEWRDTFYKRQIQQTLFGEQEFVEKDADFEQIGHFFIQRLKTIFTSVAPHYLPLRNSKGTPLYLLCFAAGNPKGAPTAVRIADYILRQ
jgi:three-Cys-motif partner protein